ncbi:assimilatory nitrate reductase (NADH) alpha subunit apoprotein [Thermomonospora echinospora]|uniref:Assimilatory nitrate reductase (NADH) alpha subunit apoprotein n=1 Tax=Thermomonospora echinospora TaxID=1992 RepID=A0A1H6D811_9ACTN|nr:molybdopterin-dependent oxidoreductase [Thermomonospora echinospora]SEG81517.1 assimilatory nitrate reductase (NADH) alpha subunit apoprotein [Thermomonospora echinospora]
MAVSEHLRADGPAGAPATADTPTHCPYCALQCGMTVGGGPVRVAPREDVPANRGGLCQKGWTAAELLTVPDRLTTPLMRAHLGAPLEPCGWDEALDRIAAEIGRLQARHGRDVIGVFGGGGLTNEKAYQLGKFARIALRTSQIDYNGRFCMSSAAAALNRAFGLDRGLPGPITDVARADAVMLVGGNVAETMPPFMRHVTEMRERGGALIVVDPRRTATARQADLHLQTTPGTDLALANGMLYLAVEEGLLDETFIAERTGGFEAVRRSVNTYWPDRVERITGVPVPQLREAVRLLGRGVRSLILTARGAEQHARGTDTVTAFINLALALGLPGREGGGYGCLTGQGNGQGGREHGQKADQLPGYRRIDDPAARAHVAAVWGVDPQIIPGPGRSAYELLDALGTDDGPRALLLFGSNPVVSAPRADRIEERLNALDLLVVSDFVLSETARRADVVLPTMQWAEESGTLTNLEGRVLRRRRAVPAPAGVRSDLEILAALAGRLGAPGTWSTEPAEVFDELRAASAGGPADYSGITYQRIEKEGGVFWPCPAEDHPGTPRPFLDRFHTPDGRARFIPVEHGRGAAEGIDEDYPVYLTTGRVLAHYQSGAQTRRIGPLVEASPEPFAEMHPDLADRLGVTDGMDVRVTSRRGTVVVRARLVESIRHDTVFIPFHWAGEGRANLLTNPALDPTSRMPEFKVCAVRVEPHEPNGADQ